MLYIKRQGTLYIVYRKVYFIVLRCIEKPENMYLNGCLVALTCLIRKIFHSNSFAMPAQQM